MQFVLLSLIAEKKQGSRAGFALPYPIRLMSFNCQHRPDGGYSSWVQLPDGAIYCVYYIKRDHDYTWIRAATFRKEEILHE